MRVFLFPALLVACAHRGPETAMPTVSTSGSPPTEVPEAPATDAAGVSTSGSPPTEVPEGAPTATAGVSTSGSPPTEVGGDTLVARFEDPDTTFRGAVGLRAEGDRVLADADLGGLPSGAYRWEVHELGDCSDPGAGSFGAEMPLAEDPLAASSPRGLGGFDVVLGEGFRGTSPVSGVVHVEDLRGRSLVLRGPGGDVVACSVFRRAPGS